MDRLDVVSIDAAPSAKLTRLVELLGMNLTTVHYAAFDPFRVNPLAVFFPVSGIPNKKLRGRLARILEPTLDSGALFICTANSDGQFEAASNALMDRARSAVGSKITTIADVYPSAHIIHNDPTAAAQLMLGHRPGLPFSSTLELTSDTELDSADEKLLNRAFNGFRNLSISKLHGGRSGSIVLRVDATTPDRYCEPFIAKIGARLALTEELRTWQEAILDYIPFPYRSPPVDSRFVCGARRAVLVSRFVDRATRFDEYIVSMNDPGRAVASLFNGPLRTWRCNAQQQQPIKLGAEYIAAMLEDSRQSTDDRITGRVARSLLPTLDKLEEAWALARRDEPTVAGPSEIADLIRRARVVPVRQCGVHGDLHARNLFVNWSGGDIILIDFSHAGRTAALSRDPSRLEVSIAFDVPDASRSFLSTAVLTELYNPPMLPCYSPPRRQDGRIEAIHQIRRHVAGEGISNDEYSITTACHLLRYSRSPKEGDPPKEPRLRGLSYLLAARLIRALQ